MLTIDAKSRGIPRLPVAALSPDVFNQRYQRPGQPVILKGLLDADVDWSLDYLCQRLGSHSFPVRCYGQRRYHQDKRRWSNIGSGADLKPMLFNDYAECLRNGQAHDQDMYLAKCPLGTTPLSLSKALRTIRDRIPLNMPVSEFNLWVGPPGHLECLHYDPMDGTLIQLHGAKKIVLFPPDQWANLYPFPTSVHLRYGRRLRCWFSQVTLQSPDFDAFPQLREALPHRIEVILNAGEALYIPAGWWHEVTTMGTDMACSINRFWLVSPSRALRSWQWWRTHLGAVYAVLYTAMGVGGLTARDQC
ncbi:MAG: cupin-like domain-containing protein [Thermosynechococcaceae cyanobacterium]